MRNIGNFFALARAQLGRVNGELCPDEVLCALLPQDHHPTRQSVVRRTMDILPRDQHRPFAAACHWFGGDDPEMVVGVYHHPDAMEQRARLVDAGDVTAPANAPCRQVSWGRVLHSLRVPATATARVRAVMEDCLLHQVDSFVADTRHVGPQDAWVYLSQSAAFGLGWVQEDVGDLVGEETAPLVLDELMKYEEAHWLSPRLVEPWTVDTLARWAEVCWRYVGARRIRS